MEQPASKKRKLAPKADLLSPQSQSIEQSPPTERIDFEIFARHLQDAAVFIQKQSEPQPHTDASVLLLSWQDDDTSFNHVSAVDQVFQAQFGYPTQRWQIPAVPNASLKLGIHLSSFIQRAGSDRLVIIYYAGHSYVGHDGQVYWASNRSSDAARLKWNGLSCLMQDVNPDILLLLDTCFVPDPAAATTNGSKHIITSPAVNGTAPGSLTPYLVEALRRLAPAGPFNSQDLHNEMCARIKEYSSTSVLPIFVEPIHGETKELVLASRSLDNKANALVDRDLKSRKYEVDADEAKRLRFGEQRVLACTTFVGDGNPGMEHFEHWLRNTPVLAKSITLEGMFLGPPTMLLVSMPISIWNLVQHDKVCCFLGYISSHNMLHMYKQLLKANASAPPVEELRENKLPHDPRDGHHQQQHPPTSPTNHRENHPSPTYSLPRIQTMDRKPPRGPSYGVPYKREDGRDASEMTEAAEQLKALSHINFPRNNDANYTPAPAPPPRKSLPGSLPTPTQTQYHSQDRESQSSPNSSYNTPNSKKIDPSKYEVRCNHCSHAPFKDVSSLRKHIAAAHTRPFPCAFAFAGCLSTFGSKNEWKRHIASQHLCLQYYRCSACPYNANSPDSRGNEFNRKDLFTQHLRRMHAPAQVKRSGSNADVKAQADWEAQVKDMQHSCLVTRRRPPQQSACPKPGCGIVFDGASAWDDWTEHVGRHMERGDADNLAPDRLLISWALREGIVEGRDGMYRLCPEQRMHSSSSSS